ncbi:MAG: 3-phosphoshikimate 1-carboxyvinyltransferase [Chloroflexi bacterium]|nr:3-phosphoshikimate 1-carboxyvinyltransferase [Chloroflexota bacterium]
MTTQTRVRVRPDQGLQGETFLPGDKSISHRALMLGALAEGTSQIQGFLPAGDTHATLACIEALGVRITRHSPTELSVHGVGLDGLEQAAAPLNCINAGTAIRLLAGILAGQPFPSVLDGSPQLRRRPMRRVTEPLRMMGADIEDTDGHAPLYINNAFLNGITYRLPVASAQIKSCVLLAGLFAEGTTAVIEPGPARDHTERMLRAMGATVENMGETIMLTPPDSLQPLNMMIPGDISSAAFLLVAGAMCADGDFSLRHVGTNPTRTGILDALSQMGTTIQRQATHEEGGEPVADLIVQSGPLRGIDIGGDLVVRMIDEFPVLMVAATQAQGRTSVVGAHELRVKETDRLAVMTAELRKLGANIRETDDGFEISGPQVLHGAVVNGHDDHRVAMSLVVAGLVAMEETLVEDASCIADSFPGFIETLQSLGADVQWVD